MPKKFKATKTVWSPNQKAALRKRNLSYYPVEVTELHLSKMKSYFRQQFLSMWHYELVPKNQNAELSTLYQLLVLGNTVLLDHQLPQQLRKCSHTLRCSIKKTLKKTLTSQAGLQSNFKSHSNRDIGLGSYRVELLASYSSPLLEFAVYLCRKHDLVASWLIFRAPVAVEFSLTTETAAYW